MLMMMKRESGAQTVAINSEMVQHIEPAESDRSRICFPGHESVVVDGAVEQVAVALAAHADRKGLDL
jgi:hypothetical protein